MSTRRRDFLGAPLAVGLSAAIPREVSTRSVV